MKLYYVRCWMTILFLYPFFAFCGKSKNKGEKVSRLWVSFLPLKWEALEMGPGCSVSGNKYFTAGNANKHWAATVLYLMAIFQFLKNLLPEEVHSSQISWYFNRHNIILTCINGINVFRNDKLGNSCSVDEYLKMLGSSSFFRERTYTVRLCFLHINCIDCNQNPTATNEMFPWRTVLEVGKQLRPFE